MPLPVNLVGNPNWLRKFFIVSFSSCGKNKGYLKNTQFSLVNHLKHWGYQTKFRSYSNRGRRWKTWRGGPWTRGTWRRTTAPGPTTPTWTSPTWGALASTFQPGSRDGEYRSYCYKVPPVTQDFGTASRIKLLHEPNLTEVTKVPKSLIWK